MSRLTICILVLFSLALGLVLPSWLKEDKQLNLPETEEAWIPNYQAQKMKSTLYDKSGQINHQVYAEKMENY
ncbi:LPS export ABC transporter periplasmic protein LptC, partial [Paraglaciecola sp.]